MYKAVSLTALTLVSTFLGAWGQKSPLETTTAAPADIHFPFNPNQSWALEESLLVWHPFEDDADYALKRVSTSTSSSTREETNQLKHPSFDWSTGVRLKLTRYLPSNDPWDVNLIATYFYGQGDGSTELDAVANSNSQEIALYSTWNTTNVLLAQKAEARTHMNFFTIDLTAGRNYSLTRKVNIHPFVGVRSVLNYQVYKANYTSSLALGDDPFSKKTFNGDHDFWAVGPRIGTDLAFYFGRHWSLLATFGASLFAGRYSIDEQMNGKLFVDQDTIVVNPVQISDKDTVLRSNIDASFGLGWEKWVRGGTVRIAPSFVFEVSEWFSMKRWINAHMYNDALAQVTDAYVKTHRRYSDLGLMGFNINLQVDF